MCHKCVDLMTPSILKNDITSHGEKMVVPGVWAQESSVRVAKKHILSNLVCYKKKKPTNVITR